MGSIRGMPILFMSDLAYKWAWKQKMSVSRKLILLYMAHAAEENGLGVVSVFDPDVASRKLYLSKPSLGTHVAWLIQSNFIRFLGGSSFQILVKEKSK